MSCNTLVLRSKTESNGSEVRELSAHAWNKDVCQRFLDSAMCLGTPRLMSEARKLTRLTPDDTRNIVASSPSMMLEYHIPQAHRFGARTFETILSGANGDDIFASRLEALEEQCREDIARVQKEHRVIMEELTAKQRPLVRDYVRYSSRKEELENQLASLRERFVEADPSLEVRYTDLADDVRASMMENERDLENAYSRLTDYQQRKMIALRTLANNREVQEIRRRCDEQKQDAVARFSEAFDQFTQALTTVRSTERAVLIYLHKDIDKKNKNDEESSESDSD